MNVTYRLLANSAYFMTILSTQSKVLRYTTHWAVVHAERKHCWLTIAEKNNDRFVVFV